LSGTVQEQEDLIKALYLFKLEALTNYNKIYNFNQDTFNNSQYLAWYNENKRQLESQISSKEARLLEGNIKESEIMCQNLLVEGYETIKSRIEKNYYSSKTCDEYLRDHEAFLNTYLQKTKGPHKVKKLVEFLSIHKPEFMNSFVKNLEDENTGKLQEMNEVFQQTEKKKKEAEDRNKELNDIAQNNNDKVIL
jgi:Zn-finger protein